MKPRLLQAWGFLIREHRKLVSLVATQAYAGLKYVFTKTYLVTRHFKLLAILLAVSASAIFVFRFFSFWKARAVAVQPVLISETGQPSSFTWNLTTALAAFCGTLLLVAVGLVLLQSFLNRDKKPAKKPVGATPGSPPTGGDSKKTSATEKSRFAKTRDEIWGFRNHPVMFLLWVPVAWFAFTGVLWLFQSEMATWGWPRDGVSAWKWLYEENSGLFYFTPAVILTGIWFLHAKSYTLKTLGVLIWIPLFLVWLVAIFHASDNSSALNKIKDRIPAGWMDSSKADVPAKPTRYKLCWTKPPGVDGRKAKLRSDCYENAVIIRNDEFVFEFVVPYMDNYKDEQMRFFWDKTSNPEMGTWSQTTPKSGPKRGEWYMHPDGRGGFIGQHRDQYTNGEWVSFYLEPMQ